MGKITILEETTKNPITMIGQRAGICYGSDISNNEKNYKRGLDCIKSNHGRTLEFPDVHMILDGYSARVMREWYTHIVGAPTRLQSSTRYINYKDFDVVVPYSIEKSESAMAAFDSAIASIRSSLVELESLGIPKEDSAMLLPLGMESKMVDKRNLRNLIEMSHQRMCNRAYWEYRELFSDMCNALSYYSEEWEWIVANMFMPKCKYFGKCTEARKCGKVV